MESQTRDNDVTLMVELSEVQLAGRNAGPPEKAGMIAGNGRWLGDRGNIVSYLCSQHQSHSRLDKSRLVHI
jgi:hypothetical protein